MFMYKNEDGWHTIGNVSFVSPIKSIDTYISKNTKYEPLVGTMKYPSRKMSEYDIHPGDTVSFAPDSEYEFMVDGELMYRIYDNAITLKL